ncbi:MAG: cell division protein ZapA [Rhodocyclaceae bacterium]|jgi:cell division protein ZapA|nr:cell division protein ZapA [Rhodocyclaceae bacterium]
MTTTLDIRIQGREYRVACAPGEIDSLQAAAALLDARMSEIAKATRSTGERLAVMTALNLAHELNTARQHATPHSADQAIDAEESLRRIQAIEARLDEALAPQEKLF